MVSAMALCASFVSVADEHAVYRAGPARTAAIFHAAFELDHIEMSFSGPARITFHLSNIIHRVES